jgi:hypothetical protein
MRQRKCGIFITLCSSWLIFSGQGEGAADDGLGQQMQEMQEQDQGQNQGEQQDQGNRGLRGGGMLPGGGPGRGGRDGRGGPTTRGRGEPRAEIVDNFLYEAWARFQPGASVTLRDTLEIKISEINQTNTMETLTTYVLKAVKPDRVELDVSQQIAQNNRVRPMPKQVMVVPAKVVKGQEMISMKVEGARDVRQTVSNVVEKREMVDVVGVRMDSIMREYTIMGEAASMSKVKAWYLSEVPGGVVKVESRTEGAVQSVTRLSMVEFKPAAGVLGRLDLPTTTSPARRGR